MRSLRSLVLLALCTTGLCAQDGKVAKPDGKLDGTAVRCVFTYEATAQPGTDSLRLQAVLPDALPGRQQVKSSTFSQPPSKEVRENGVRYAIWELAPAPERLTITATVELELLAPARAKAPAKAEPITAADWLAAEQFVEVDDPAIRAAAKTLGGKAADDVARRAARYVGETLQYGGFQEQSRGAAAALQARSGDCTEFADLMVALLRARGVPARHCIGLMTEWNDTAKHSWVEVHLGGKRGWVLFDPTLARSEPDRLLGPAPTYVMMSPLRHDRRLDGKNWFHFRYTGAGAKVTGAVAIRVGKAERSCPL